MGGTFAVLTFLFGTLDMLSNHCATGCLAPSQIQGHYTVSAGTVFRREDPIGSEIFLRKDTERMFGPFQVTYGLSATDMNDYWVGVGASYRFTVTPDNTFIKIYAMPGLFALGDGPSLGGPVVFRSGIEFGFETDGGIQYGISYDHRSSSGFYETNAGIETLQFRVSIPTR